MSLSTGPDPRDPSTLEVAAPPTHPGLVQSGAKLRVGFVRNLDPGGTAPEPAILAALDKSAAAFAAAGATVREIAPPIAPSEYGAVTAPINRSESFSIHEQDDLEHRRLIGRALREKLEAGLDMRAAGFQAEATLLAATAATLEQALTPSPCRADPAQILRSEEASR